MLSNRVTFRIPDTPRAISLYLRYSPPTVGLPFPDGSQGVFYYHADPASPPIASEIRYRLCGDVEDFDEGLDLLSTSGTPWHHPV